MYRHWIAVWFGEYFQSFLVTSSFFLSKQSQMTRSVLWLQKTGTYARLCVSLDELATCRSLCKFGMSLCTVTHIGLLLIQLLKTCLFGCSSHDSRHCIHVSAV